jgi:hypothetical protein
MTSQPFLTIFTRACYRPTKLIANIESVQAQTDQDLEQVFVIDNKKRGLAWANSAFWENKHRVLGQYVFMLDDDNFLLNNFFVERLKALVATYDKPPGAVLVRAVRAYDVDVPPRQIWNLDWEGGERPKKWVGNGRCVVTRADLWKECVDAYRGGIRGEWTSGGDWHFVTALIKTGATFVRMRMRVSIAQNRGSGQIFEKCGRGWFKHIAARYRIDQSTLKLEPWRAL